MKNIKGLLACFLVAVPSYFLGKMFPVVGGPVIGIIAAMIITLFWKDKGGCESGINFTSKKILQYAVVLLGFGLNLNVVLATGRESLPIIVVTISTSLIIAYLLKRVMNIDSDTATLVGVGSSICGGSAIAATAPVIGAKDEDVAKSISVIFFFNVLAALLFPMLGNALGFSATDGNAFGVFAGTAVNDTSSVTATAATWDSMHNLGTATLDKAVTVKLTRTLAIIPITLGLSFIRMRKAGKESEGTVDMKRIFPTFILYFILASVITTVAFRLGVPSDIFAPFKTLSKFFIVMAMVAIGFKSNIVDLVKNGGKALFLGLCCWVGITGMSLLMQHLLHIW